MTPPPTAQVEQRWRQALLSVDSTLQQAIRNLDAPIESYLQPDGTLMSVPINGGVLGLNSPSSASKLIFTFPLSISLLAAKPYSLL